MTIRRGQYKCDSCGHTISLRNIIKGIAKYYDYLETFDKECPHCMSKDITKDIDYIPMGSTRMLYACRSCRQPFIVNSDPAEVAAIKVIREFKANGIPWFTTKDVLKQAARLNPNMVKSTLKKGFYTILKHGYVEAMGYKRSGLTNDTRFVRAIDEEKE